MYYRIWVNIFYGKKYRDNIFSILAIQIHSIVLKVMVSAMDSDATLKSLFNAIAFIKKTQLFIYDNPTFFQIL